MRAPALALLLLLPAFAGCLDSPGATSTTPAMGTPEAGTPLPGSVLSWGLTGCQFVVAFVDVPAERIQPLLPPGFEVATSGFPPVVGAGQGYLGVEAFVCESGEGLAGNVTGMQYGSLFTGVLPPENLTEEGVEQYYYKWNTLVPDADRLAALANAGMTVHSGEASVTPLTPLGQEGPVDAALVLDGVGRARMVGTAPRATGSGGGFPFIEFSPAVDGLVKWRAVVDIESYRGGEGWVELEAGTFAAELAGATEAPATFTTGVWTFRDGSLTLPTGAAG